MNIEKTLKSSPRREVLLAVEPGNTGRRVIVKRFLIRGPLGGMWARSRARREHGLLAALHGAGVAVPRPLGLTRTPGAWEVHMEHVAGAVPLGEFLRRTLPADVPPSLPDALGALLARVHAVGLDHPDLHLGNLLVDEAAKPWLVDLHGARRRRALAPARIEEDLAIAAAALREPLGARRRARMLVAWWRAVGHERRAALGPRTALAARLEDGARARRRAVVERGVRRWRRTSGRCVREQRGGRWVVQSRAGIANGASILRLEGLWPGEFTARWTAAVRLHEHRVPVAVPLRLVEGRGGWAEFALPDGAAPVGGSIDRRALGELLGCLHDRGLDVPSLGAAELAAESPAGLVLRPPAGLEAFDPRPGEATPARRFRAVAPDDAADAAFRAGYVAAFRGGAAERAALTRELEVPAQ